MNALRGCLGMASSVSLAVFFGLSTMSATALAQAPTDAAKTASTGKDAVARAKELFDVGAREYSSGDFDLAIQAFEQAYAIAPRDGIMFSMAQAHRRQYERAGAKENLARSVALFKSYVDKVKSGGRVTDAVKALGQLEPELKKLNDATGPTPEVAPPPVATKKSRVVVNIYVDGTTVSIDGGPPKKPPVNEEVKPGPHRVKLSAPGFFDEERAIDVGEGEIAPANLPQRERPAELTVDTESGADISVDGRYIGEAPLSRAVELPSGRHYLVVLENGHDTWEKEIELDRGKKHVVEADLSSTTQRDLSYAVFAGAGAFAATGIVFGALAIERQTTASGLLDDRQSRALSQAELEEYEDAKKSRSLYTGIAIGTAGGGVALAILGTGLVVFDKPRAVAAPQVLGPGTKPTDGGTPEPSVDEPKDVEMTTSSLDIGPGYVFGSVGFSF